MDAQPQTRDIVGSLPWLKIMLDYTDVVCQALPADGTEIRPVDPRGGFVFSAKEQALHIADERWSFIEAVTGEDCSPRQYTVEYPGKDQPWQFREASRDQILASLQDGRAGIDAYLAQPVDALMHTTPALAKAHEERLAKLRADGKDTATLEARGPSTLLNQVLFLASHETGHRAVLQHMLRMHGVEVTRFA